MLQWDYNIYIGDSSDTLHIDFAADDRIFLVGEVGAKDEDGALKEILDHIKEKVMSEKPSSLDQFSEYIDRAIEHLKLPLLSLAAGYHSSKDDIMYFRTIGNGEVYIARAGLTQKLISNETTSSGIVKDNDYFLLANKTFTSHVDIKELQKLLFNTKPQEIVETLTPDLKGNNDTGMIAMFMQAYKGEIIEDDGSVVEDMPSESNKAVEDESAEVQKDSELTAGRPNDPFVVEIEEDDEDEVVEKVVGEGKDGEENDDEENDGEGETSIASTSTAVMEEPSDAPQIPITPPLVAQPPVAPKSNPSHDMYAQSVSVDKPEPARVVIPTEEQYNPQADVLSNTLPNMSEEPKVGLLGRVKGMSFSIGTVGAGLRSRLGSTPNGKKITIGIVVILIALLSWSVLSGSSRRERAAFDKRVTDTTTQIDEKLDQSSKSSTSNTQAALTSIEEAQKLLDELKAQADEKGYENVLALVDLQTKISDAQQNIVKEEDGKYEAFYDMQLISKNAQADAMYTDGELIALLDTKADKVYVLTANEKSVDTYSSAKIGDATDVALYNEVPYIFGKKIGVHKLGDEPEELISPDKEWGDIKDFWIYGGNIYMLDASKDEIYKYLVIEEGFSDKKSYVESGPLDFSQSTAMAIDSAIYITRGDVVTKYVGGVQESFDLELPDTSDITFEDIFTDLNTDDVYIVDTDSGRIFISSKDGDFKKQISAKILKNAEDTIYINGIGILVLDGNTIYVIEE